MPALAMSVGVVLLSNGTFSAMFAKDNDSPVPLRTRETRERRIANDRSRCLAFGLLGNICMKPI